MTSEQLTEMAEALYKALDEALPSDLNVEGAVTPGGDVDDASIVLGSAFDRIDEVLDALRAYERGDEGEYSAWHAG